MKRLAFKFGETGVELAARRLDVATHQAILAELRHWQAFLIDVNLLNQQIEKARAALDFEDAASVERYKSLTLNGRVMYPDQSHKDALINAALLAFESATLTKAQAEEPETAKAPEVVVITTTLRNWLDEFDVWQLHSLVTAALASQTLSEVEVKN